MDYGKIKTRIDEIQCDVLDKNANPIGEKTFYHLPNASFLSEWMPRTKKNDVDVVPLINAVTPSPKTEGVRNTKWSDNAIAHFFCNGNDLQNAGTMTAMFSSVASIGHAGGYFVTPDTIWKAAVMFSVRRLVRQTWINDRDQFLKPDKPVPDTFKNDCIIWFLFNGSNLTSAASGLNWNGRKWDLVNHFVPFTEAQVGATDRFESDLMAQYLSSKKLSKEANAVLDAGRTLWTEFFKTTDVHNVRQNLKLNRPDVGWYQVRNALRLREEGRNKIEAGFAIFEEKYSALSEKLEPQVYELGFLKP